MDTTMIQTRTIKTWLGQDGILWIITLPAVTKQTAADALDNIEATDRIRLGKKRPALVDLREALSTDLEGRQIYSQAEMADRISAAGLIVGSPISRVIGSLFLGVSKLPFPVRLFGSEEQALAWLKGFLEQE